MKGLCSNCNDKSACTKLCEEAEKYANQDWSLDQIPTVSEIGLNIDNFSDLFDYGTCKSDKRLIYELYFLDDKSVDAICGYVTFSRRHIFRIVEQLQNNISIFNGTQYQILHLHFIQKMKSVDIVRELGNAKSYVSEVISNYLIANKMQ